MTDFEIALALSLTTLARFHKYAEGVSWPIAARKAVEQFDLSEARKKIVCKKILQYIGKQGSVVAGRMPRPFIKRTLLTRAQEVVLANHAIQKIAAPLPHQRKKRHFRTDKRQRSLSL